LSQVDLLIIEEGQTSVNDLLQIANCLLGSFLNHQ
jgi:hypothetical protein